MAMRCFRFFKKPVTGGMVLLSYVGVFLGFAFTASTFKTEAEHRTSDICFVIINVHRSAQFRYDTEKRRLAVTTDYLRDPQSKENKALYGRVKENLPAVQNDVRVAKLNVQATTPPDTCKPYVPKGE